MKPRSIQSLRQGCPSTASVSSVAQPMIAAKVSRTTIRPQAILEVVRRRGRSWGLLAQYEEGRLGLKR